MTSHALVNGYLIYGMSADFNDFHSGISDIILLTKIYILILYVKRLFFCIIFW